jgi:hypothetical protein
MLLLSTDSEKDLSQHNSKLIAFKRELPPLAEVLELRFLNKWFVASREGCSCGFRHLHTSAIDLGFDTPQEWYEEDPEDIAATLEFVAVIQALIGNGQQVDCIDVWGHETASSTTVDTISVNLSALQSGAFRLMEGYHFVFSHTAWRFN